METWNPLDIEKEARDCAKRLRAYAQSANRVIHGLDSGDIEQLWRAALGEGLARRMRRCLLWAEYLDMNEGAAIVKVGKLKVPSPEDLSSAHDFCVRLAARGHALLAKGLNVTPGGFFPADKMADLLALQGNQRDAFRKAVERLRSTEPNRAWWLRVHSKGTAMTYVYDFTFVSKWWAERVKK